MRKLLTILSISFLAVCLVAGSATADWMNSNLLFTDILEKSVEPASMLLLGLGLIGLADVGKKKKV
jgi:hypothetical protein